MILDFGVIDGIFWQNLYYLIKLLIVSAFLFYYLPSFLFPQNYKRYSVEKVVVNFVYMTVYVEVVVTFMIFMKIFSITLFIIVLFFTKFLFLKYYYKKEVIKILNSNRIKLMIFVLEFLDAPKNLLKKLKNKSIQKIIEFQDNLRFYNFLKNLLFISVFVYIISIMMYRGLLSVADSLPDTDQFIEWVAHLQQNILYEDTQMGADMYGISVLIFFVTTFTNIDSTILFSIYPVLLILALYFSIYYVLKDFSSSKYVAIFGVIIHGLYLMTPLGNLLIGYLATTNNPNIVHFLGMSFYDTKIPEYIQKISIFDNYFAMEPFHRYISGMAYEHSSVFVLLNSWFLIKTLNKYSLQNLLLYIFTLILVFTFHGGGAIPLIFISLLIFINSIVFRKLNFSLLKKGMIAVFISAIVGNLWMLSVLKFGLPKDFGAAAPFLDKLFGTATEIKEIVNTGFNTVAFIKIEFIHLFFMGMLLAGLVFTLFTKRKFINSSLLLISLGIFIEYFGPTAGMPVLTLHTRLYEYYFLAITLIFGFYYYFLFYKPMFLIFKEKARYVIVTLMYLFLFFTMIIAPKWPQTILLNKNIQGLEYTEIPQFLVRINKTEKPFSWTIVSYVQEYPKVRDKGFHINTQEFLLKYSPLDKYLKISTERVFVVVENFSHPFRGLNEWFYRWRDDIENKLRVWIALYAKNYNNIKIVFKNDNVTIYEIDNQKYLDYLTRKKDKYVRTK
jgi:hypothetical protein